MTDYPIVRFTPGPGMTPANLNLNNATPFTVNHEGFSFGAPSLEADPLSVAAPYGWRTLSITVGVDGTPDGAASSLSALSVELLRRTNWLMFQFSAETEPVWIQTYKSAPPPLDFTDVASAEPNSRWQLTLEITADAFVRGRKVEIPELSISNNPLAGGISAELPAIVGDTAAPLEVNIISDQDMLLQTWLVSTTAVDERCTYDFSQPIALPTADFNVAFDTYIGPLQPGADALGGQWRRTTAALSTDWKTVLENPVGETIPIGNYRVLARLRERKYGDDYGTIGFRVGGRYNFLDSYDHAWQDERRVRPTDNFGWHDLGNLYLPTGARPDGPTMLGSRRFGVQVRTINGDDPAVDIGGFLLIPVADSEVVADSRVLKASMGLATLPAGQTLQVESRHKRLERNPRDLPLPGAKASGGFPQVVPGYRNYLHITGDIHEIGAQTVYDLNRTYTLRCRYHPQYLHPVVDL